MTALILLLPRLEKSGDPLKRQPYTLGGLILSLILGAGGVFVYSLLSHSTLVWFGVAVVASFFIALATFAVQKLRNVNHRDK